MQEKVALWTDASDEFTGYLLTNDKEEVLYDSCAIIPEKRNRPFNQCTNLKEFQVQDTAEKGQGLFCKRQFKEGSFVLEYVGEVRSSQDDGSGGHSAYRMMVDDLTVIDGIDSGHPSRSINHSCEPNHECQRWCVYEQDSTEYFGKPLKGESELFETTNGIRYLKACFVSLIVLPLPEQQT